MTLGITGGIGSGKSYVAQRLATLFGIPIYDCDREAKRLMLAEPIRHQLVALLGEEAYLPDGQLNKPLLASYTFGSEEHHAAINAIVHPEVKADFKRWYGSREEPLVGLESAILVEAGFTDVTDKVLVVEAPERLRIERVAERDGFTHEEISARMRRQVADEARHKAADYIVVNDGRNIDGPLRNFIRFLCPQLLQNS